MRAFLWLLTLALTIECFAGGLLARFVMQSLADIEHRPPMFDDWFFGHPIWWFLVPIPWLVFAAILSRRPTTTTGSVLIFAGTVAVTGAFLLGVMIIAAILPLLTFKA
jgi:hypothetical protein